MQKDRRYLITTSDNSTWEFNEPILFLGDWCINNKNNDLNNLNYKIASPYGIGKEKRDNDHCLARDIEKEISPKIANILNKIHKKKFSNKYWYVLFRPWLRRYIEMMINRVSNIIVTFDNYNIIGTTFYNDSEYILATKNCREAILAYDDELWNNILYKNIIKNLAFDPIKCKILKNEKNYFETKLKKNFFYKIFILVSFLYNKIINFFPIYAGVFLDTKLSMIDKLKLFFYLKYLPILWRPHDLKSYNKYDFNLRKKLMRELGIFESKEEIAKVIFFMAFQIMPKCFLEDYAYYFDQSLKSGLPKNPKYIATSYAYDYDDVFKFWAANKIEYGNKKYIIFQHGNNYGTHRYINPSIEEEICDNFVTWGWANSEDKYIRGYILKTFSKIKKTPKSKRITLIIEDTHHRYWTYDSFFEYKKNYEITKDFINKLPKNNLENLVVRVHEFDRKASFNISNKLLNSFPELNIEYSSSNYWTSIQKSRIVIFNYDSTGILELISLNIPFLAFWNNKTDHLRDEVIPYYNLLEKAGIIHYNIDSLISKLTEIDNDVDSWWQNDNIQSVRKTFCELFARTSKNTGYEISKIIKSLSCNNKI